MKWRKQYKAFEFIRQQDENPAGNQSLYSLGEISLYIQSLEISSYILQVKRFQIIADNCLYYLYLFY